MNRSCTENIQNIPLKLDILCQSKLAIDIFFFVVLFELTIPLWFTGNCKKKSCSKIGSFLLNFAIN